MNFTTFWKNISGLHFFFWVAWGFKGFLSLKTHSDGILILLKCTSEMKLNNSRFIIINCFKWQSTTKWNFSVIFQRSFFGHRTKSVLNISKCEFSGNYCKFETMSTLKSKSYLHWGYEWLHITWLKYSVHYRTVKDAKSNMKNYIESAWLGKFDINYQNYAYS